MLNETFSVIFKHRAPNYDFLFWLMQIKKNLRRIFQAENDCSLSSIKSSGTTAQVHEFVGQHCHFMTLLKRRYHTVSSRNWKEEEFEKYVEWNCHLLAREKATCEKSWNISGIRIKIQSDTLYELFEKSNFCPKIQFLDKK